LRPVGLGHNVVVFRRRKQRAASGDSRPPAAPPELDGYGWNPLCLLRDAVREVRDKQPENQPASRPGLLLNAATALRLAATLVTGLDGARDLPVGHRLIQSSRRLRTGLDCMGESTAEHVWHTMIAALADGNGDAEDLYIVLTKGPTNRQSTVALVCARSGRNVAQVDYFEAVRLFLRDRGNAEVRTDEDAAHLEDALIRIAPWIRDAIDSAIAGTPVSAKLGQYTNPVATQLWFRIADHDMARLHASAPSVLLSARRLIAPWLIENKDGDLFFFPPAILQAGVVCAPSGVRLRLPRIQRACGAYDFRHPYVGDLKRLPDRFLHADMAVPPVPAEIRRVFTGIERRRPPAPGERAFCIANIRSMVGAADRRMQRGLALGRTDAVREGLEEVLQLACRAATTSHRNNAGSMPMAALDKEHMYYTWPVGRQAVPAGLRARIFTYDGRSWSPGCRPGGRT
jgi:hypothetical protein